MRYRPLGPSGVMVSELSFGCGHLPDDDEESTRTIHAAIDAGCNYFETATFYCNGRCQQKTALGVKRSTDKIMLSAKMGVDAQTTAHSYRKAVEEQLETLGVDSVNWLQVGWLSQDGMTFLTRKGGALNAIEALMDEGIVKHLGFTGHDTPAHFIEILHSGLFESMTVSYNLLNRRYQPAITAAQELGVGVVVMNPVGGGILGTPSPMLQGVIPGDAAPSTAALALRYVLANSGVSTACSGMSSPEMIHNNVVSMADTMREEDYAHFQRVLQQFAILGELFCTGCRYCDPCPYGVDIATCFHLYNLATVYGLRDVARERYAALTPAKRAASCHRCGKCEDKCPNTLPIIDQLDAVRGLFEVVER